MHSDATIYEEDVELFLTKCEEGKDGYPKIGEVDNLQGSPSCRGFSRLNRGGKHDEKNNLLSQQMVRATRMQSILSKKHSHSLTKVGQLMWMYPIMMCLMNMTKMSRERQI